MKAWPTRNSSGVPPASMMASRTAHEARRSYTTVDGPTWPRMCRASSAVRKSPATNPPFSSMKKQRSASPSQAMPRSAPFSTTAAWG